MPVIERQRYNCGYDFLLQPLKVGDVVVAPITNRSRHGAFMARCVILAPLPKRIRVSVEYSPGYYRKKTISPARCVRIDHIAEADKVLQGAGEEIGRLLVENKRLRAENEALRKAENDT